MMAGASVFRAPIICPDAGLSGAVPPWRLMESSQGRCGLRIPLDGQVKAGRGHEQTRDHRPLKTERDADFLV